MILSFENESQNFAEILLKMARFYVWMKSAHLKSDCILAKIGLLT